jgi:uncharacterized protein with HEPN domain
MNNDKDHQTLRKMLERIERTIIYCRDQTFESFQQNTMLQEACVFNILQIGELAKYGLSDPFVASHPDIPWHQINGMRNRIVHGYEGVRLHIVWETITENFPELQEALAAILD